MSGTSSEVSRLTALQLAYAAGQMRCEQELLRAEPIAVIGLGCRFPSANNPQEFWQLLQQGVDAIGEVPADRWDASAFYDSDPSAAGKSYCCAGGFLDQINAFDADFFGISPREAASLDPQQRLLLEVCWEALEDAQQSPDRLFNTAAGVFVGMSSSDYLSSIHKGADPAAIDGYFATGNAFSVAAGRLSYFLGLTGPSLAVDTACSSSLVSVHLACQSLRGRECNLALAAGVNLLIEPDGMINFSKAKMLAPDGRCKTFSAAADGFARGEGCGVVVLKRLADAVTAGDRVLAVLRGSAVGQDGPSASLTAPNGPSQQAVLRQALEAAGVDPRQVSYVEAHGTGTELGDPIEIEALGRTYGAQRGGQTPLLVGSVKTNFGHLEAAAGIAGLIKVILSLEHNEIPAHLHFDEPSPHIQWGRWPITVASQACAWPPGKRLAGVSSFGFSGTNAHVVLEEPPVQETATRDPAIGDGPLRPSMHLLPISAKTPAALHELAGRYRDCLMRQPPPEPQDVCDSASRGRAHFAHRLAAVGASTEDLATKLEYIAKGQPASGVFQGTAPVTGSPKLAFLFSGQGAQYPGMGRQLYDTEPAFREAIERCDGLLQDQLGERLATVLFGGQSDPARLDQTLYTQPALFAFEFALAELWKSRGIRPDAVLGHSIGEYAAACVAEVFSLPDALKLLAARARLMQSLPGGGGMLVLLTDQATAAEAIRPYGDRLSIAVVNGPRNVVLSGAIDLLEQAAADLKDRLGVESRQLRVSHAFHSALMDPVVEAFHEVAAGVRFSPPRLPFISSVTGELSGEEVAGAEYWSRQIRHEVRFADGVQALLDEGCRLFLEIGPGATLCSLGREVSSVDRCDWLPGIRKDRDEQVQLMETAAELYVRGRDPDSQAWHGRRSRRWVDLPTYPFQRQRHWFGSRQDGNARLVKQSDVSQWFYQRTWKRAAPPVGHPLDAFSSAVWLLFADDAGICAALAALLEEHDQQVVSITPGEEFCRREKGRYTVAADRRGDYARLLSELDLADRPLKVVHLWNVSATMENVAGNRSGRAAFDRQRELGYESLLALAQALGEGNRQSPVELTLVSASVQDVAGSEPLHPEAAIAVGASTVIEQEFPHVSCRSIDILTPPDEHAARRLGSQLAAELCTAPADRTVALRGPHRWAESYEHIPVEQANDRVPLLRADGVYAIVGELKSGLGLVLASYLAERTNARLALLAPDLDPVSQAPQDRLSERIGALRESGTEILAIDTDPADAASLRTGLDQIEQKYGVLHGVLHVGAMGSERSARLVGQIDPQASEQHFRRKVLSLMALEEALAARALDFVLVQSSLSAVIGGLGFAAYAAASACVDQHCCRINRQSETPWLCVNWDACRWEVESGGSMGAETLLSELAITEREAGHVLDRVLGHPAYRQWPEYRQWIISTADLPGRIEHYRQKPPRREQEQAALPEIGGQDFSASYSRPQLATEYVAPRNDLERQIIEVWEEFLPARPIGVLDNYFEVGGSSLAAIQIISRLRERFQVEVPIRSILIEAPTAAGVAEAIARAESQSGGESGQEQVAELLSMIEQLSPDDAAEQLAGNND